MDCSPPGSSVHWISQARTLEWTAHSFFRGSSWPRDQTRVSCVFKTAGRFFTHWATGEAQFIYVRSEVKWSCSVVSDSLWPHGLQSTRLLCPWDFPGNILEWIAISFSRGSSQPRDWTRVSHTVDRHLTIWAAREVMVKRIWTLALPRTSAQS